MNELTREEIKALETKAMYGQPVYALTLEDTGALKETALALYDRAERAEAERDDNQAIYNMYFQDIGKAIGDNRKRRWTGEPSQSDAREIRDMKAEREALKDVLRELVEAVRSCDTMRVASAIARAEDALNT